MAQEQWKDFGLIILMETSDHTDVFISLWPGFAGEMQIVNSRNAELDGSDGREEVAFRAAYRRCLLKKVRKSVGLPRSLKMGRRGASFFLCFENLKGANGGSIV